MHDKLKHRMAIDFLVLQELDLCWLEISNIDSNRNYSCDQDVLVHLPICFQIGSHYFPKIQIIQTISTKYYGLWWADNLPLTGRKRQNQFQRVYHPWFQKLFDHFERQQRDNHRDHRMF